MVRRKYNNACGRWHRRTRTTEDPSPFRRAGRARGRTVKSSRTHHHGRGGVRSPGGEARGDARRAAAVRARVVVVVGSYHRYPCLLPRAAAPPAPSYGRAVARGTAAPAPHPTHPVQLEPSLPRDNYAHLPPAGLFPRPVCRARTPPARGAGQPAKPEPSSLPGRFLSLSLPLTPSSSQRRITPSAHSSSSPTSLRACSRAPRSFHRRFHHFSLLLRSLLPHLQRHRFPWRGIFLVLLLGCVCVEGVT
jgi:hypothetical protein